MTVFSFRIEFEILYCKALKTDFGIAAVRIPDGCRWGRRMQQYNYIDSAWEKKSSGIDGR